MTTLDQWIVACLAWLAVLLLLCGLDDLAIDLAFFYRCLANRFWARQSFHWPSEAELQAAPCKHIAIFVALWREHRVIEKMLEHNIAANRYGHYDFFVGVYPNDPETVTAVQQASNRFPNVHLAMCPHDGPTSKADCLNWVYQRMLRHEEQHAARFDIVVVHDAEDLIHSESLRWINYFAQHYDMVQIPVLPLPTPFREWTHGVYCDDFAEFQTKDIPVRQMWGGFLPSNGVGAGFSRALLEKLARAYSNRVFEPACLTEDHENGFRIHALGCSQLFVPIHVADDGRPVATREFFPRSWTAALKQRTRWTIGISLQFWEHHGWQAPARQLYWFWRDRKGLLGNLVAPLANLLFVYGALTWLWSVGSGRPWNLGQLQASAVSRIYLATLALAAFHLSLRMGCVGRIYGWGFALGVPLRAIWGNWINCTATLLALHRYCAARVRRRPLVWVKTDHAYPSSAALMVHKRRLGEVLVGSQYLSAPELEFALASQPPGRRIGEHLIGLGKLSEPELYEALGRQQNMPFGRLAPQAVSRRVTRALPAEVSRKWKVLPFRVSSGQLFVAGPELPSDEMTHELQRFSSLEIRFQLVTPTDFEELAREYLP